MFRFEEPPLLHEKPDTRARRRRGPDHLYNKQVNVFSHQEHKNVAAVDRGTVNAVSSHAPKFSSNIFRPASPIRLRKSDVDPRNNKRNASQIQCLDHTLNTLLGPAHSRKKVELPARPVPLPSREQALKMEFPRASARTAQSNASAGVDNLMSWPDAEGNTLQDSKRKFAGVRNATAQDSIFFVEDTHVDTRFDKPDVDMRRSLPPQAPLPQASTAESVHVYKQKHFPHAYNHELQQQYQMLRRQQEMRSTHHPHAEEYAFAQAQTRTNPPIRGQMQAHTQQQRQQEQYYNFHDSSSSLDRQASTQAHTYTQSTSVPSQPSRAPVSSGRYANDSSLQIGGGYAVGHHKQAPHPLEVNRKLVQPSSVPSVRRQPFKPRNNQIF